MQEAKEAARLLLILTRFRHDTLPSASSADSPRGAPDKFRTFTAGAGGRTGRGRAAPPAGNFRDRDDRLSGSALDTQPGSVRARLRRRPLLGFLRHIPEHDRHSYTVRAQGRVYDASGTRSAGADAAL